MLDTVCITGSTLMPSSVMRLSSSNPFDDAFTISFVGIISCRSTFFITLMPFTVISPSVSVVSTSSESVWAAAVPAVHAIRDSIKIMFLMLLRFCGVA